MRKNLQKTFLSLLALGSPALTVQAQTTYLNPGSPEYHLADRLETKTGILSTDFNTAMQPLSRKALVRYLGDLGRDARVGRLSTNSIDEFNINRAISISGEWHENASGESGFVQSKRPILKYFYQTQTDLVNVETDDFFLSVNPVLYLQAGYDVNDESVRYINTRGLELRGRIADRVGFYTMLADNQERIPGYLNSWVGRHRGQFPGTHYAAKNGETFDIFLARGYVDFALVQDHATITFGYDKQHVGFGIRSLVLSNNAAPSTFVRLRANWKNFFYESVIIEQIANNEVRQTTGDGLLPKQYAAVHQLNYVPTSWLSLGIFESTVFSKGNKMPAGIFVPIIGYQSIAGQVNDDTRNNAWGLQFKVLPVNGVQLYGQAFLDKLDLSSIGQGSWKNQYGVQLGLKYYDVATLKNLDGQLEFNAVRPFTYAPATDSAAAFAHYNQPMAHPLGNNFMEVIAQLRYQPATLWTIEGRGVYAVYGDNPAGIYTGSGIYLPATNRAFANNNEYPMLSGTQRKMIWGNLNVAYELRPNLFLEAGGILTLSNEDQPATARTYGYGGLRWNISRSIYDYK